MTDLLGRPFLMHISFRGALLVDWLGLSHMIFCFLDLARSLRLLVETGCQLLHL